MMVQMASSNTIIQTVVSDAMRGRVMSFYSMSFMGMAPFGGLLAGALAHRIGAPRTVTLSGVAKSGAPIGRLKSVQLADGTLMTEDEAVGK